MTIYITTGLDRSHNEHWGKLYRAQDVKINWHVPTEAELNLTMVRHTSLK